MDLQRDRAGTPREETLRADTTTRAVVVEAEVVVVMVPGLILSKDVPHLTVQVACPGLGPVELGLVDMEPAVQIIPKAVHMGVRVLVVVLVQAGTGINSMVGSSDMDKLCWYFVKDWFDSRK